MKGSSLWVKATVLTAGCLLAWGCSAEDASTSGSSTSIGEVAASTSIAGDPPVTTTSTTAAAGPIPTTTLPVATPVASSGSYGDADLAIRLAFRSEVPDVSSTEFATVSLTILNDPAGWMRAGFTFEEDERSNLILVLAEGERVDELCLPLETFGTVSCQNGEVVALNADRWRNAWEGWDSTTGDYRHYLVTHEVGHLLGLRHPADTCPPGKRASAVMDPQTRTTLHCPGNGVPLDWEIQWASSRPAFIGPLPEWDGPRATWPTDD